MSGFHFDDIDDDVEKDEEETFIWGGRSAVIFLIDAVSDMLDEQDESNESHFKKAIRVHFKIYWLSGYYNIDFLDD